MDNDADVSVASGEAVSPVPDEGAPAQNLPIPPASTLSVPEAAVAESVPDADGSSEPESDGTLGSDRPFVIQLQRLDVQENGNFHPGATVEIAPTLRTSGLLAALPAEELKTLLCMLTFTTANGACQPIPLQVAEALHIAAYKARSRLERLAAWTWSGEHLICRLSRENVSVK